MAKHPSRPPYARGTLQDGALVDHYRLVRLLGKGGMGEVYLARDNKLGRKVALKVILGEAWADENRRLRFLAEARVTAGFNHPHIVTVYGVGAVDGCGYVALEYLEGQTLRQRLRGEALGVREALRFALAIAQALAEAHAHRILHWDLKPANVMLPSDGRLRVVDFGLARALSGYGGGRESSAEFEQLVPRAEDELESSKLQGTPRYMAPERWLGREAEESADIWSYGLIVQELFGHGHPYSHLPINDLFAELVSPRAVPLQPMPPDVSRELAKVFDDCLDKNPANRPAAAEIVAAIEGHLSGVQAPASEDLSPFRGLFPFTERHASLFFGRDPELDAFLERMRTESILPVVGPSGAGKSSFVQAGVVPRLRERGPWLVLHTRPGRQPFTALSEAFEAAEAQLQASGRRDLGTTQPLIDPRPVGEQVLDTPGRLGILLLQLAERSGSRVLLAVDQLEELYTLVDDAWGRRRYMQAVCSAADDVGGPVRVVLTLRDDFLGRVSDTPEAREALRHITVLRSPEPGALHDILACPVRLAGYEYEDAKLVDEMVDAVRGEHAGLPILQFACAQLWQHRDRARKRLTRAAYEAMGGVAGALARHSDSILDGLTPAQVRTARSLFLRLVTPQRTRRIVTRTELIDGLGADGEQVLEILTNERVLAAHRSRGEGPDAAELELVHESLLRNWERLARWTYESGEELAFIAEASHAAELWEKRGRPRDGLWRGDALRDALRMASRAEAIPPRVQAFLHAGRDWESRRKRRKQLLSALAFLTLVVVILLFAFKEREARQQRRVAEEQREAAELQRAQTQLYGAEAALARGQLPEARALLRGSLETRDSAAARTLWWRLQRSPLLWAHDTGQSIYDVAFDTDGSSVFSVGMGSPIHVIDRVTTATQLWRGGDPQNFAVAVSGDGKWIATGGWSGRVRIRNRETGTSRVVEGHASGVLALRFAPDSSVLASGGLDNVVKLWEPATGQELRVLRGHTGRVNGVAFYPDGRTIVSASSDGTLRTWDRSSGEPRTTLRGNESDVLDVAMSGDGKRILSAGGDGSLRVWSANDGRLLHVLRGHTGAISAVDGAPDGVTAATGSIDATVRTWDIVTGVSVTVLRGHESAIDGVRFSPNGRWLASGGRDGKVRLWRMGDAYPVPPESGHRDAVLDVAFRPDGRQIASVGHDGTVRLWDAFSGEETAVLRGHDNAIRAVDYHPDGHSLASAGEDLGIRIWDPLTGGLRKVLYGHESTIHAVRFDPSGKLLASGSSDATVRLWDVDTGSQIMVLRGHARGILDVAFSRDGTRLASASSDGTVRIWDVRSGRSLAGIAANVGQVWGVSWVQDGKSVVFAGLSGETITTDLRGGARRLLGKVDGRLYGVALNPSTGQVGVPASDETARIWPSGSGAEVVLRGHGAELDAIAFSPDGSSAVTAADDGTVRVWDTRSGRARWFAPVLAGNPPALYSHRGWLSLDGSPAASTAAWQREVDRDVASASSSRDGRWLCTRRFDGSISAWDITADTKAASSPAREGVDKVQALDGGCAFREHRAARMLRRDGSLRELAPHVTAMNETGQGVLLAGGDRVVELDANGRELRSRRSDMGVSAVLAEGDRWVVGYDDGAIEVWDMREADQAATTALLDLPSSAVTRLVFGPMGTLVAGFEDGVVGIWDPDTGRVLVRWKQHGAIAHLMVQGSKLVAVTELGQLSTQDFGVFREDSCEVIRDVWKNVPVAWDHGRLVSSPPPRGHRCDTAESQSHKPPGGPPAQ